MKQENITLYEGDVLLFSHIEALLRGISGRSEVFLEFPGYLWGALEGVKDVASSDLRGFHQVPEISEDTRRSKGSLRWS